MLQADNTNKTPTPKIVILLKAPKSLIVILALAFLMDIDRRTQHFTLLTLTIDEYIWIIWRNLFSIPLTTAGIFTLGEPRFGVRRVR